MNKEKWHFAIRLYTTHKGKEKIGKWWVQFPTRTYASVLIGFFLVDVKIPKFMVV